MIHNRYMYINLERCLWYNYFICSGAERKGFICFIWLHQDGDERSMVEKELVEVGGSIPIEKFHVSPLNVRAGEHACMHAYA